MSDEVKPDQPQKPEPVAEKETTSPEAEAGEDKPTPLPTLGDKENKHAQPTFKKPFDAKPQLTPEKMEEAKLSAKYGKLKPGGSDFLRKKINKGVKYFDSGDYNMEKQSGKLKLRPGSGKPPGLAGAARLGGPASVPSPLGSTTGKTIPTPATIPHRKQSTEISKLAV